MRISDWSSDVCSSDLVHPLPMLSIENAFSAEDVEKFLQSVRGLLGKTPADRLVLSAEPKIDGLSLSLRYKIGELVSDVQRGNGVVGEDGTLNAKPIADIPNRHMIGRAS